MKNDDIAIVSAEKRPTDSEKQLADVAAKVRNSPSFVMPGTGGKTVRYQDGRTVGPIGGELLRRALARGARVISEEPVKTFKRPIDPNTGLNIA